MRIRVRGLGFLLSAMEALNLGFEKLAICRKVHSVRKHVLQASPSPRSHSSTASQGHGLVRHVNDALSVGHSWFPKVSSLLSKCLSLNDYFLAQSGPPVGAHMDSSLTSISAFFRFSVLSSWLFTVEYLAAFGLQLKPSESGGPT